MAKARVQKRKRKPVKKAKDDGVRNYKWIIQSNALGYNPERDQRPKSRRKNHKMDITHRKLMPNAQARWLITTTAVRFMDSVLGEDEEPAYRMGPTAKNMIIEVVANNLFEVARCARNYAESAKREMITEDDMRRAIADQGTRYTRHCIKF